MGRWINFQFPLWGQVWMFPVVSYLAELSQKPTMLYLQTHFDIAQLENFKANHNFGFNIL